MISGLSWSEFVRDASVASGDAAVRVRKERVHATMLIELLALLVFLAIAFAFILREEGDRLDPWKERAEQLEAQVSELQTEVAALKAEIASLQNTMTGYQQLIRRLMARPDSTLTANSDVIPLPREEAEGLLGGIANAQAINEELQRDNAELRRRLAAARGGVDLPRCTVTPGYLLAVQFLGDGSYRVSPLWTQASAAVALTIPGAREMAAGGPFTRTQFLEHARRVSDWGKQQAIPCGFRVRVTEQHQNLELYKLQLMTVEQHFYVLKG